MPSLFPFFARLPLSVADISDLHSIHIDDGQPQLHCPSSSLLHQMPYHLDISQTRFILAALGPQPDHEAVENAKAKLSLIESSLSKKLEELVLSPSPSDVDRFQWRKDSVFSDESGFD